MEVRRATAPARSGSGGPSSGGRGGADPSGGGTASNGGTTTDGWITTGVGELSKRRLANDPAMMRELRRYQKLMLLTLLPAISGEATHAHLRAHAHGTLPGPLHRGRPEGAEDPQRERAFDEHLPRPEPTDGFPGVAASSRRSPSQQQQQQARSAGSQGERAGKTLPAGPASAGTRLPLTVYNPLDASPRPAYRRRRSHEDAASPRRRRRRRSHGDDQEEEEEEEDEGAVGGNAPAGGGGGGGGGELDMLTLAALYLESRHRVFGQEWHHRPDSRANSRPSGAPPQVGATGVARPRRLTPLSPTRASDAGGGGPGEGRRTFSAVMPTPAGLHLSVNYTHNLGLEESAYLSERARALRPRLRRLSSMDDLLPGGSPPDAPPSRELQKATSAPDLSDSGHGRRRRRTLADTMSRISSTESVSPPLATPARANTPTEARHSAALARPQMVGGSLASSDALAAPPARLRHLPEAPRAALPPTRPPTRPPEPKLTKDLPFTPVEGARRGGRIHLQPLTLRKSSE